MVSWGSSASATSGRKKGKKTYTAASESPTMLQKASKYCKKAVKALTPSQKAAPVAPRSSTKLAQFGAKECQKAQLLAQPDVGIEDMSNAVPLPMQRSLSSLSSTSKPQPAVRLNRAQSAPPALSRARPFNLVQPSIPSITSNSNYMSANSEAFTLTSSRGASATSSAFQSATSSPQRLATPRTSNSSDNEQQDWTIPALTLTATTSRAARADAPWCVGFSGMSQVDREYEAFLLATLDPPLLAVVPPHRDAMVASIRAMSAKSFVYATARKQAASPVGARVGCLGALRALLRSRLNKKVQAAVAATAPAAASAPEATTSSKVSILAPLKALGSKADQVVASLGEELRATGSNVRAAWGSATSSFRSAGSSAGETLDTALAGLRSAGSSIKQRVSTAGSSMGGAFDTTTSAIQRRLSSAGSSLGGALDEAKAASDQAVSKVNAALVKAAAKVKASAKSVKKGMAKGIKQAAADATAAVRASLVGQVWSVVVVPHAAEAVVAAA